VAVSEPFVDEAENPGVETKKRPRWAEIARGGGEREAREEMRKHRSKSRGIGRGLCVG